MNEIATLRPALPARQRPTDRGSSPQHRGRAAASRRDPDQQRRLRPDRGDRPGRAFLRSRPRAASSRSPSARIQKNALATPVTLKALPRGRRRPEGTRRPRLSRPPRRRRDLRLRGARLCPDDLRPRRPPRAHRRSAATSPPRAADDRGRQRAPRPDRRGRTARSTSSASRARPTAASSPSCSAVTDAVHVANAAYQRDGGLAGLSTGLDRPRQEARRPAPVGPADPRRAPVDGQDLARHQHRLQHRQRLPARAACPTAPKARSTAASSASSRSRCRPSSSPRACSRRPPRCPPTRSAAAT